ncbi:MAG: nucleotidyltransferase domain-containing protein [Microcoleus sp.]
MRGLKTWQAAGISPEDARRIQNAADRTKQTIIVVGSRANGTSTPTSDWDYIMLGNSRQRHSARTSVPRGTSGGEINNLGRETGIDIFTGPLIQGEAHVIFEPNLGETNESN